ncbi:MAG: hypothetical protein CL840_12910 [Crocinitomicaceae bacterium]|nr:hypothetical protein [Crocinitomicaceae bacterium]|tara:strand:- start:3936 stop:4433 length:498 start_codon:yes stop_codon:yes gene_type:complete
MVIHIRALIDTEEDIFRDIEIQDSATFEELHYAILDSFEWEPNQMASFYKSNEDWDKGEEIPLMDIAEEFGPTKKKVMSEVTLAEMMKEPGQKMLYIFDFMLMWCFYIDIISIKEEKEGVAYPQLTMAVGDSISQYEKEEVNFSGQDKNEDEEDEESNFDDLISY